MSLNFAELGFGCSHENGSDVAKLWKEEFSPERVILTIGIETEGRINNTTDDITGKFETDLKTDAIDEIILDLIKKHPNITIPEIMQSTDRGRSSTKDRLEKLKAKGLLRRVGPDKGGYWEV